MTIFAWDPSYLTGIEEVDGQHRGLVDLINSLDAAIGDGRPEPEAEALVSRLTGYALEHFATEERLMQAAGPGLADHYQRHKAQHDNFVETIRRLTAEQGITAGALGISLLDFLVKWLIVHILGQDKEMAVLLAGRGPLAVPTALGDEIGRLHRLLDSTAAERNLLGALHESELRFRLLADHAPLLIWMGEHPLRRSFLNRRWSGLTGVAMEALAGEGWLACLPPEDATRYRELAAQAAAEGRPLSIEYRLRSSAGRLRWMLETAVPRMNGERLAGFVGAAVDITERKAAELVLERAREALERKVAERTAELCALNGRLEAEKAEQQRLIERLEEAHSQLLQSEKMASIGQLAAGVAHEINNPVGYVISNLGTLERYVGDLLALVEFCCEQIGRAPGAAPLAEALARRKQEMDFDFLRDDLVSLLAETGEGARRVKQIVQDLKEFSHVDEGEWQQADLNRGLESTLNVVWNELKYKAEVVRDYGDLPPVACLPGQLNQVFLNMLVNAAQAIEQRGTITVRTRHLPPAVVIEIGDTGSGIPESIRSRIFDPFFTTKQVGSGTGLGLSIAYGIVQRHAGRIEVESEEGRGTTFRIVLPAERGG